MSIAEAVECVHCGTLVSQRAAQVDEDGRAYCCAGCLNVAEIVRLGGWDRFYVRRDGYSPRPEPSTCAAFDSEAFEQAHVAQLEGGHKEVRLQVGGVRCAACTWLLERAIGDLAGVEAVHVSYGTSRATLSWDPGRVSLSAVARRIETLGYQALAIAGQAPAQRDLLTRLGVAAFCAINVMLLSVALYAGWFEGMAKHYRALFRWGTLLLATPAVLYSAAPFFSRALTGLQHRVLQMDVPIAIAVGIMYAHGFVATFAGVDTYLDSLTMLIALLTLGRLVEQSGRSRAEAAATAVMAEAPATARRLRDGVVEEVAASDVSPGETLVVGLGDVLAVDAEVSSGTARLDTSTMTGESVPVPVAPGDTVMAGALVVEGNIEVRATAVGRDTLLTQMAEIVARGRSDQSAMTRLADRIAPWFTGVTLGVAGLTLLFWSLLAGFDTALPRTIAVLVVACPCALALATPTALATGIASAARRGAFIGSGEALEGLASVDVAVLDKTGTLTEGRLGVTEADDETLRLATGLERVSGHPIARAILQEAARRRIPIAAGEDVEEIPGVGIRGLVEGRLVMLRSAEGGVALWEIEDVCGDTQTADVSEPRLGQRLGHIRIRDRLRADSVQALRELAELGVTVHMLTGDRAEVAEQIALQAGLHDHTAAAKPLAKAEWVIERQQRGGCVLFAGDGVNDAPAIAQADVGVAMARGTAAAVLAADVVIVGDSIAPISAAIAASRLTKRAFLRNSVLSIVYNVFAVAAAVGGLVNPLVAAILMPVSSLMVLVSSLSIERSMRRGHSSGPVTHIDAVGDDLRRSVRAGSPLGTV